MTYTIDPDSINSGLLAHLFLQVAATMQKKTGTIPVTDMLAILNLPEEVNARIRKARGPLTVSYTDGVYVARNRGTQVEENIPGTGGWLGLILHPDFRCEFAIEPEAKTLVIDNITGLDADGPGFFNFDVDRITIRLPRHVELEV
jgi:hypothetical protein